MSQDRDAVTVLRPRRLLRGEITYASAKEQDANILHQLGYRDQRTKYFTYLYRNRQLIQRIVRHHLNLSSADPCQVVDVEDWIHGSFNVCIRVDINAHGRNPAKQLMLRFPLPYRIGENSRPGNADEKVRCEVGTFAWLQENCPTIPIPQLYGFGLSTGQTFTIIDNLPLMSRIYQQLRRRLLGWLNYPTPSSYVQHRIEDQFMLGSPYILIEYIDPPRGKMLSETWEEERHNPKLRMNLFRGLSQIILKLARFPLPRIGSFVLDDNGYLKLRNRPLTVDIQQLENEHIPVDMPQDITHSTVDSYVNDILALHESRLRHQPNGIHNLGDGSYQTSALMVMRSVWPCFFRRDLRQGPFFLNLTDLSQSNIFVDDNWNVKYLIDLEWACSQPVEMIQPPYWLSNQAIDLISIDSYETLHKEFMEAFAEEEKKIPPPTRLYPILKQGWEKGTFWCCLALSSPTALFKIFYDHIQPKFTQNQDQVTFSLTTMPYWTFDTFGFIEEKIKDKEKYDIALREVFESGDADD